MLLEPEMPFKVLQGVTSDVVGNCGSGVVPFEAGLVRFRRHGSLRRGAMGLDARAPSDGELARMQAWVREGVAAGAVGLSTGLIYEPGRYANTDEIVALARELSGSGALYATHMRDEADGLLDAVAEAIRVGEEARVPVQISHHKASGRRNWGRVRRAASYVNGSAVARDGRYTGARPGRALRRSP